MTSSEASIHAQSQHATGLFRRCRVGDGLNGMNLVHDLNIVYNFIESLRGENGITVFKNGDGTGAIIDGLGPGDDEAEDEPDDDPYVGGGGEDPTDFTAMVEFKSAAVVGSNLEIVFTTQNVSSGAAGADITAKIPVVLFSD